MSDKYFLDTNILVYTFDEASKKKKAIADQLVEQSLSSRCGIISTQVVQEFLNVATRKFSSPMSASEAKNYLKRILEELCQVFPSIELYKKALNISEDHKYSFYDSLIIAAAIHGGCKKLYTEDLKDGHSIEGLKIQNPF